MVIRGLVHNDDPDAATMWMPAGSFWTQPKGEVHITAAKGETNLAYIEIESGPYLVLPPEEAFDSGERPVNLDRSNVVWIDPRGAPASVDGPKVAFLWGKPQDEQLNGSLVKLPAGFMGTIRSHGASMRAVVIQGALEYGLPGDADAKSMEPGGCFLAEGMSVHPVACSAGEACVLYVRMMGKLDDVVPGQRKP